MNMENAELDGKCIFNDKIQGRIAEISWENEKFVTVQSYNRYECPLPGGKPLERFSPEQFWQWIEENGYKVVDPINYSPM